LSGQTIESPEVTIFIAPDCDGDGVSDVEENRQGTDPCAPPASAWARLRIVSGNFQWAPPATVLPRAVTLRLSDASSRGYPNAGVYFSSFAGGVLLALDSTGPWLPSVGGLTDEEGQLRLWVTTPGRAGQLGIIRASSTNGPSTVTIVATALDSLPGWTFADVPVALAAGGAHSLALLASGTVWAWGANLSGQLGEGLDPSTVPFSAVPLPVPNLSNVVAVAAGGWHSMALRADGTVAGWGEFAEQLSAVPPADLSDVIAVAAGESHSLALVRSGTVRAWGDPFTRFEPPATLTDVTAIAAGSGFSLALRANGTVVAWGLGPFHVDRGQLDVPAHLQGVRSIAAGGEHGLALLNNGTVVAWGANDFGQCTIPSGLTNVTAIDAGFAHSIALRDDGTVVAWGDDRFGQVGRWSGLRNVTAVAAGGDLGHSHNLVLQNGAVVSWGSNALGELGDGSQLDRDVPVQVAELTPAPIVTEPVSFELYTPLR
jgi:alpha-tubulin suppressor-like RCC1 family protein